jgi:hypothetical protein
MLAMPFPAGSCLRDDSTSEMMVMPGRGVECSAKKAMTTLSGGAAAMGLLPNSDHPRRIFLKARVTQIVNHETGRSRRLWLDCKFRPICRRDIARVKA